MCDTGRQGVQRGQFFGNADPPFEPQPFSHILGLKDHTAGLTIVLGQIGRTDTDGVALSISIVGKVLVIYVLSAAEGSVKHHSDRMSFTENRIVRRTKQFLRGAFEDCFRRWIDGCDETVAVHREHPRRDTLEDIAGQPLDLLQGAARVLVVNKGDDRGDPDRAHEKQQNRDRDEVSSGLPEQGTGPLQGSCLPSVLGGQISRVQG